MQRVLRYTGYHIKFHKIEKLYQCLKKIHEKENSEFAHLNYVDRQSREVKI